MALLIGAKPMKHYTVMLDEKTSRDARKIGGGNLSKGLRDAVRAYKQRQAGAKP